MPARSVRAATGASRPEKARRPAGRDGRSHESKIARQSGCSHVARPPHGKLPEGDLGNASACRPGRARRRIADRLVPVAGLLQRCRQSVMSFRETRMACDQRPIAIDRGRRVDTFALSGGQELSLERFALALRGVVGDRNDLFGSKPASLAGGRISTGMAPTRSAYDTNSSSRRRKSDRIVVIFDCGIVRYVDQVSTGVRWRRDRDSTSIGRFANQDAKRGVLLDPDRQESPNGWVVCRPRSGRCSAPTRDANRIRCVRNR